MDDSEASHFRDHFSGHAESYAAHRPGYPPELAEALAGLAFRGRLAWDVGCGPGRLTVHLAGRFRLVLGTDASRRQLAEADPAPGVRYVRALAEEAPIASGAADLITAAQAAHWFEIERFYEEARRVAAPEASLALVTYDRPRVVEEVDGLLDRFHDMVLEGHWSPRRRHVDSRYSTLPFPFEEVPVAVPDIREEWTASPFLAYVETWSGTRALEAAGGRERIDRFREGLVSAWGGADRTRAVRWPLTVRAGRVGSDRPGQETDRRRLDRDLPFPVDGST